MNKKQNSKKQRTEECTTIVDSKGQFVYICDNTEPFFRCEKTEILDMKFTELMENPTVEDGRKFERMFSEKVISECTILRGDNTLCVVKTTGKPKQFNGKDCIECTVQMVEEIETSQKIANMSEQDDSDIEWTEKCEIAKNIRIDTTNGTESLKSLLCDILEGHAEVQKYRKGALTLCEAIDQRLVEEQARNPDSKECEVLRESKEIAYELYEKIEK